MSPKWISEKIKNQQHSIDPIRRKRGGKLWIIKIRNEREIASQPLGGLWQKTMAARRLSWKTSWLHKSDHLSSNPRAHVKSQIQWCTAVSPTLLLQDRRQTESSGYSHQQKQETVSIQGNTHKVLCKHISEKLRATNFCQCHVKERYQSTSSWSDLT